MTHNVTSIIDYDHTYLFLVHESQGLFIRKESIEVSVNVADPNIVEFKWHWSEIQSGPRLFYLDFNTVTDPATGSADQLFQTLNRYIKTQHHFPTREITSDHTLVIEDAKCDLIVNSPNLVTITIPPNSAVPFHLWEEIHFTPYGLGSVNFVGDTNVTLLSELGDTAISGPYNCCYIRQTKLDVWKLCGDIETFIDPDVQDFLDASGITDETIINALNNFVVALKAENFWVRFIAIYPLVGGTAATHKWNLIDPQDTDAAFRYTFGGTVTHASTGATIGASGNMRSKIVPATHLTLGAHSVHAYIRNNDMAGNKMIYGASDGTNFTQINPPNATFTAIDGTLALGDIAVVMAASTRLISLVRTATNALALYRSGVSIATNTETISALVPGFDIWFGSRNNMGTPDFPSVYEFALAMVENGTGFTSGEMTTLNSIVDTFETDLGRQV